MLVEAPSESNEFDSDKALDEIPVCIESVDAKDFGTPGAPIAAVAHRPRRSAT
jgi:hypothetical protein